MALSLPDIKDADRRWWTLGAMCFALFMVMLDNTVVNVALPSIQRDLGVSTANLEWTVNAYTLTFAVLLVTGGRMGDIFGRRRWFLVGVAVFGASSLFIAFSQTASWLVIGRAAQGVGAAFMMPATLSIITNAFPPQERGKAIGTWAGMSAVALAIGPVVGGFLVEHVSWQSIFLINVPIAVVAVAVTLWATRESRDPTAARTVDVAGVGALSVGMGALVLGLVEGNAWGWGSPRILGLFALALLALSAFFVIEHHVRAPMLDFTYFRSRSFLGANLVAFIVSFAMLAMFFFLALYMQNVRGYSPLEAGVRFLPSTVVIIFMGPIAGRLADKVGPRPLMSLGLVLRLDLAVRAELPRARHAVLDARARVRPHGRRDGSRDVADEHRRDERRRSDEGGRRVGRAVDEPHGRRHVRGRGDRSTRLDARSQPADGPAAGHRRRGRSTGSWTPWRPAARGSRGRRASRCRPRSWTPSTRA